ncbi:MAG: hypothetical protein K8S99_11510 [Planctomycetes bacterium]|nr:hypothetical protein [Planctomycetota bacterium]
MSRAASKPDRRLPTADAAAVLGIAIGTLRKWVALGCPHSTDKPPAQGYLFSAPEVRKWMADAGRTGLSGRPRSEGSKVMLAARIRKESALANLYEGQVRRAAAHLLDADDVRREWDRTTALIRATIEPLGASLAPLIHGKTVPEIQVILDNTIADALRRLAASAA